MKHALLGAGLIFFALFFSPAFIEPYDVVISTGYILVLVDAFGSLGLAIAILWASLGYISLLWGMIFIGHSISRRIPFLRAFHIHTSYVTSHPIKVTGIIFVASLIMSIFILTSLDLEGLGLI